MSGSQMIVKLGTGEYHVCVVVLALCGAMKGKITLPALLFEIGDEEQLAAQESDLTLSSKNLYLKRDILTTYCTVECVNSLTAASSVNDESVKYFHMRWKWYPLEVYHNVLCGPCSP